MDRKEKYSFKPYSDLLPLLFQKEKERIAAYLQGEISIEHVGSTSIEGLGGKGIIDIAISTSPEKMDVCSEKIVSLGYEFRPSFSTEERRYFICYLPDPIEGRRRYHIHLTFSSSAVWKELIGFRDYLRLHKEIAEEYEQIKRDAAKDAEGDGALYRKRKEPFLQKVKEYLNKDIT